MGNHGVNLLAPHETQVIPGASRHEDILIFFVPTKNWRSHQFIIKRTFCTIHGMSAKAVLQTIHANN